MKLIFLLSLIPVALSLPQPQPSSQHSINPPPHVQNFIKKRAFGAGDSGIQGTSVASEKDTSTLTSLIMFQPSSEPTTTVTGTIPVSSAASSSSSSDEGDQIVSPFYPSTNDDEEESDSDDSVQTLGQGQSAAFNPTASTTLSLLTNSLATGSATANGTKSSTTGSASAAVVAAASDTGSSTSGSEGKINGWAVDKVLVMGALSVMVVCSV